MMLDLNIWKIQSCENIHVPWGSDKWGPTVVAVELLSVNICISIVSSKETTKWQECDCS